MKAHILGLVAISIFATGFATPANAEWLEAKSKHFVLTGDVPEATLQRRVERLERFDAALRLFIPQATDSTLPIVVVGSADEVRSIGHLPDGVLAYFSPSPYGVFAITPVQVSSDTGIGAESVLFHEYVHHMLMGSVDDPMPRWMNEGMAELFMNTRLESDGSVVIGLGNSSRGYSLSRLGRWTVEDLFDSDRNKPSRFEIDQIYAKGWLTLHYLIFSGKRPGQFGKFAELLKKGVSQLDAARQAFGDLGKLEDELEFYRQRKELPAIRISADNLNAQSLITTRRLDQAEAEMFPLRVRSMAGVRAGEAIPLAVRARPVADKWPNSAFVQRAMAEMEFDARNYAAADAAIDRAVAADPANVDAMAFKGLLLGARARRENRADLWREARSWILKANRANPDNPLPLMLFFDSFTASSTPVPRSALDGLLRAIVLQPSYHPLRAKAAVQFIENGDNKTARYVLAPAALAPHLPNDSPMTKLLAALDAGASKEDLDKLVAGMNLDENNLFVQSEPRKPDKSDKKKGDSKKSN